MSIRAVSALAHYTNWVVGHVHSGALGWVGMISFAILYWLVPRLWDRKLYSEDLATYHFWLATIGIVVYTVTMWAGGLLEGLMWRAVDDSGQLTYPVFMDIVNQVVPFYWLRVLGGLLYLSGALLMGFNLVMTMMGTERFQAPDAVAAK